MAISPTAKLVRKCGNNCPGKWRNFILNQCNVCIRVYAYMIVYVYMCICVYVCMCVCASHREDGETQHSGVARRVLWKPEGCKSRSYLDLYLFSVQKPKFGTTSRRPKAHFSVACCFSVARRAFWKPKGCKSVAIWTYFLISSESDLWHDQPQAKRHASALSGMLFRSFSFG